MIRHSRASKNPDILASAKALRRAARRALELGRRTRTPVYVLRNGRIVDLVNRQPWPGSPRDIKTTQTFFAVFEASKPGPLPYFVALVRAKP